MSVTFEVSQFENTSIDVNCEHPKNMFDISVTFEVFQFSSPFKDVNCRQ